MQQEPTQLIDVHQPARIERSARALIGWMAPEEAARVLCGNRGDVEPTDEQKARVSRARRAVSARDPGLKQEGAILGVPPELEEYAGQLREAPAAAPYFGGGWEVAMVDLSRIVSFQPTIFDEQASERVENPAPDDVQAHAQVTLPVAWDNRVEASVNEHSKSILASSPNPNLQVTGLTLGPIQEGAPPTFGFQVAIMASYVQVARYNRRLFLRDGYHRAIGFLGRGISKVPAFFKDVGSFEELGVKPGMLLLDAFMGERPPSLPDFLDDSVAASVRLPAVQKMVVVHALEVAGRG